MMHLQKKYGYLLLPLLFLLLTSCEEENGSSNVRSLVRFNFISSTIKEQVSLFDSLTVTAEETQDTLIYKASSINHISLPLPYEEQQVTYMLSYSAQVRDTVWLTYTNAAHFISMQQGISMYYTIKTVEHTKHLIDSIVTQNPVINETEKENFQMYFTTTE